MKFEIAWPSVNIMCARVVTFIVQCVHSSIDLSALAFMTEDEAVQITAVQVL